MFRNPRPPSDSPQINPEWVPPQDPVFNYLIQEAAFGSVPTYFAEIPLARLKRFEPRFRPDTTPAGREVVATIMSNCRAGNVVTMWVYPKGKTFIVADDCFTLAASELGEPDRVPCWVLGNVAAGTAQNVQGPTFNLKFAGCLGWLRE